MQAEYYLSTSLRWERYFYGYWLLGCRVGVNLLKNQLYLLDDDVF